MHVVPELLGQCRNCRAVLAAEPRPLFCWQCGQETQLHEPTFLEFVHEFIGHYVAVEGSLWRTLKALVASPGRLTAEYFAGRRKQYVLPLRLYLTTSFVFFLLVKMFGAASGLHVIVAPVDLHGQPISAATNPAMYREMHGCIDLPGSCSLWSTATSRFGLKADAMAQRPGEVVQHMIAFAPFAVFMLLPLFAAIVMLVWRSSRMNYGGHFVFSLHTHALWFIALTVLAFLPGLVSAVGLLVLPIHTVLSLHRVHGDGWVKTLGRSLIVATLYGVALLIALIGLGIGSVVTG